MLETCATPSSTCAHSLKLRAASPRLMQSRSSASCRLLGWRIERKSSGLKVHRHYIPLPPLGTSHWHANAAQGPGVSSCATTVGLQQHTTALSSRATTAWSLPPTAPIPFPRTCILSRSAARPRPRWRRCSRPGDGPEETKTGMIPQGRRDRRRGDGPQRLPMASRPESRSGLAPVSEWVSAVRE